MTDFFFCFSAMVSPLALTRSETVSTSSALFPRDVPATLTTSLSPSIIWNGFGVVALDLGRALVFLPLGFSLILSSSILTTNASRCSTLAMRFSSYCLICDSCSSHLELIAVSSVCSWSNLAPKLPSSTLFLRLASASTVSNPESMPLERPSTLYSMLVFTLVTSVLTSLIAEICFFPCCINLAISS